MEKSECDFHYEPYRRVPMNSATTQREWTEYNSIGTFSSNSNWSKSRNPPITTTYIDGITMLGQRDRSKGKKDFFPKSKARQNPSQSLEKKDARYAFISLVPADQETIQSAKSRSTSRTDPLSSLPSIRQKNVKQIRSSAIVFDDDSQSKFYARRATTNNNDGWIRRFKSINRSHILSDILRDQSYEKKNLLKKRSYQQSLFSSSSSSLLKSLNKRRREKC